MWWCDGVILQCVLHQDGMLPTRHASPAPVPPDQPGVKLRLRTLIKQSVGEHLPAIDPMTYHGASTHEAGMKVNRMAYDINFGVHKLNKLLVNN